MLVFDRCTGALTVLAFVLGVVAVIVGGFGAVALVAGVPSPALGAVFLAVGLSFAAMTHAVVRKFRRRRSQPLHECRRGVIDRKWRSAAERWSRLIGCASRASCRSVRAHPNWSP